MDAREFLGFRREGAVCDHDGSRTVVDTLCADDLLHRVVPDSHIAAKLRLDDLLRILTHHDEVAALIPLSSRVLRGIAATFVKPLYERFETGAIELSET